MNINKHNLLTIPFFAMYSRCCKSLLHNHQSLGNIVPQTSSPLTSQHTIMLLKACTWYKSFPPNYKGGGLGWCLVYIIAKLLFIRLERNHIMSKGKKNPPFKIFFRLYANIDTFAQARYFLLFQFNCYKFHLGATSKLISCYSFAHGDSPSIRFVDQL